MRTPNPTWKRFVRLETAIDLLLAIVALGLAFKVVTTVIFVETGRSDLKILYKALNRFIAGEEVYRISERSEHTKAPILFGLIYPFHFFSFQTVRFLWDCLNLILPLLFARTWFELVKSSQVKSSQVKSSPGLGWRGSAVLTIIMAPLWAHEIRYGQYNLFGALLVLYAWVVASSRGRGTLAYLGAGFCFGVAVLFKPTHLLGAPAAVFAFLSGRSSKREWKGEFGWFLVGGGLSVVLPGMLYVHLRGVWGLIADHIHWSSFLKLSMVKHLVTNGNAGLPAFFARHGFRDWVLGPFFIPFEIFVMALLVFLLRRFRTLAFVSSNLGMVVLSPMCWRANFGTLIPLVAELIRSYRLGISRVPVALGLLFFFLISRATAHWITKLQKTAYSHAAGASWLALICLLILIFVRRRLDDHDSQTEGLRT